MSTVFKITHVFNGIEQMDLWDAKRPLGLGRPYRWMLERTQQGVRIRDLSPSVGQISTGKSIQFSHSELAKGAEGKLGRASVKIQACVGTLPIYEKEASQKGSAQVLAFRVFGGQVLESRALSRSGSGFALKTLDGEKIIPESSIDTFKVVDGSSEWRFAWADLPQISESNSRSRDSESVWFHKSMGGTGLALTLLMAFTFLMPAKKQEEKELIPAQVAKLIMKPVKKPRESAAGGGAEGAKAVTATRAIQALQSKSMQKSIKSLLGGGISRMLASSNNNLTADMQKAGKILMDSKSALAAAGTGITDKNLAGKGVQLAALGGGGAGGGLGNVGYGSGERAGVAGQGKAFVGLDLDGSSVEEGLTKDEVGKVIHAHMAEVRYCYDAALIKDPDVEGKLVVDFTIGGAGSVKKAIAKETSIRDGSLNACIIKKLAGWQFPKPKGGVDVAVSYPFIFKNLWR